MRTTHTFVLFPVILFLNLITAVWLPGQIVKNRFIHYGQEVGLPSNEVHQTLQDHYGYLWIATNNGLVRYDGYSFKTYQPAVEDPSSLPTPLIYTLYEDSEKTLWIGGHGSLIRYNRTEDNFTNFPLSVWPDSADAEGDAVSTIVEGRDGTLYAGIRRNNLRLFSHVLKFFNREKQRLETVPVKRLTVHYPADTGITRWTPDDTRLQGFYSSLRSRSGDLWFAGPRAVFRFNERDLELDAFRPVDTTFRFGTTVIKEEKPGLFWIGSLQGKLYRFDPSQMAFESFSVPLHDEAPFPNWTRIWDLHFTADRTMLVATNNGLYTFDREDRSFSLFKADKAVPGAITSYQVSHLLEDAAGAIWVSTSDRGLSRHDRSLGNFQAYNEDPLLAGLWVGNFFEQEDGSILLTTYSGYQIRFDRKSNTFTQIPGVESYCNTICKDSDGVTWVGTNGGLYQLSQKKEYHPYPLPSNRFQTVNRILEDRRGILWLATSGGLLTLDRRSGQFEPFFFEPFTGTAVSNECNVLLEDRQGNLWIGTNWGLFQYAAGKGVFLRFLGEKEAIRLQHQDINSMYEDKNGQLWIGTWQGGLHQYDPRTGALKNYTTRDGLPSNAIQAILGDEETGALWMSTFNGIARFDIAREQFNSFDLEDGVHSKQFTDQSALKTSDGYFLFGGNNGFTMFKPKEVVSNLTPPKAIITAFKLFNETVQPGEGSPLSLPILETKEIRLKHYQNDIAFDFLAINFSGEKKNQYAYRMENFDEDWRYVNTQRNATYTNLPPGSYTFRVKAANKNMIWNEDSATIRLIIAKPWWRTWWAYALYILVVVGSIWTFIHWRLYYLRLHYEREAALAAEASAKAANEIKSNFLSTVSHELRTPLTSIIGFTKIVKNRLEERVFPFVQSDEKKTQRAMQQASENLGVVMQEGERLTTLINGLLDLAKIESGKVEWKMEEVHPAELIDRATAATAALFEQKPELQLIKYIPDDLPPITADRDRIIQVLINLISNAVKFTEKGQVKVEAKSKERPEVIFSVEDTGSGIPPEHLDRVFEKFKQVDDNQAGKPKGTGLGLPICKEIVEHHGGKIWVESRPDKGSSFFFCLPPPPKL